MVAPVTCNPLRSSLASGASGTGLWFSGSRWLFAVVLCLGLSISLFISLFISLGIGLGSAKADQADPALDELFEVLQSGELSFGEAKGIEARIWTLWLEADSGSAEVLMKDGMQAMRERNLARAEESFTALIELDPDFAEAWNKRATVRFFMGKYGASIDDIKRTLTLEPRHFGAMSGLGLVYDRLGDIDGAAAAFRQTLILNPYQPGVAQRLDAIEQELEENKI
jgi:tetratricopeptide (TPR) repeat protein